MKRWSVGVNEIYREAHIYCEEGPWWVFFTEWVTLGIAGFIAKIFFKLPLIPLPDWHVCKYCLLGDSSMYDGEVSTFKEWYGTLDALWHIKVYDYFFQWAWRKCQTTSVAVDIEDVPPQWIPWVKPLLKEFDRKPIKFSGTNAECSNSEYSKFLEAYGEKKQKKEELATLKMKVLDSFKKVRNDG